MNGRRKSALICPLLSVALFGLNACSVDDAELDSFLDRIAPDDVGQLTEAMTDPFFLQYYGTWQSSCLFDPGRLTGPTTGDYVIYKLSFSENRTTWAYQDYMDEDCIEQWPYGDGMVTTDFVFSTRMVSQSGLDVAVFPRDAGITVVEEVSGDPTPDDDSSGGASVSTMTSSASVLDIVHLSSSGDLFIGDRSSAPDNDTAPVRLDLNKAWTYSSNAQTLRD